MEFLYSVDAKNWSWGIPLFTVGVPKASYKPSRFPSKSMHEESIFKTFIKFEAKLAFALAQDKKLFVHFPIIFEKQALRDTVALFEQNGIPYARKKETFLVEPLNWSHLELLITHLWWTEFLYAHVEHVHQRPKNEYFRGPLSRAGDYWFAPIVDEVVCLFMFFAWVPLAQIWTRNISLLEIEKVAGKVAEEEDIRLSMCQAEQRSKPSTPRLGS